MEGCFTFHWGRGGGVFQMGGFIFEGGGTPWGALLLVGGEGFKKNCKIGGECPTMPPTTGNPSVSILLS